MVDWSLLQKEDYLIFLMRAIRPLGQAPAFFGPRSLTEGAHAFGEYASDDHEGVAPRVELCHREVEPGTLNREAEREISTMCRKGRQGSTNKLCLQFAREALGYEARFERLELFERVELGGGQPPLYRAAT
jgi:hypothetical protein